MYGSTLTSLTVESGLCQRCCRRSKLALLTSTVRFRDKRDAYKSSQRGVAVYEAEVVDVCIRESEK